MKPAKFLHKIYTRRSLRKILHRLKKKKKKIVFTNGCFDLLHFGHIKLFQKAKTYGDVLIIGLNSDKSVKRLKGPKRPLVKESKRAQILAALECVDFVVSFDEDTPKEILQELKPDILVKGGDYKPDEIIGKESVKKVIRFPFIKGNSTTDLIKTIVYKYRS